jgi:hypothetical protein
MKVLLFLVLAGAVHAAQDRDDYKGMDKAGYLPAFEEMYQYDDHWTPDRPLNEAQFPVHVKQSDRRKV